MDDTDGRRDDFDRGLARRREVLGDAWVERATAHANDLNAEFQAFITRYAWNDVWNRPGLDTTTRRLLVLGMTMALGRWEEFELHCRAAVRAGVPLERIRETLLQGAIYCGVPAANTAFRLTGDLLRAEGLEPAPSPLMHGTRAQVHHTFSRPQLRVALQGRDDGVPVMLSHALGLDLTMWDGLAHELRETHPLLRYDHRGHGGSAPAIEPYALDALVDDAARLVDEWGRGAVAFVGLSMGGMVGQGLAIRHPDKVRALVLANTTARYPEVARSAWAERIAAVQQGGMAAVADLVVERYHAAAWRAAHPARAAALKEALLRCEPRSYAAACRAVAGVDWLDRLHEIRCPTLVIAGTADTGATPEMAQQIAERIAGARLETLDAGHLSVAEQPEAFAERLRGFLRRLG